MLKTIVGASCILVLILPALLGHIQEQRGNPPDKGKKARKIEKKSKKSLSKKGGAPKKVFFSKVKIVEVPTCDEGSSEAGKGQGRIPLVTKVKGIEAYFRYILNKGGKLVLTKGANFEVKGKVNCKGDRFVMMEENRRSPLSVQAANVRDVTGEFTRVFGGPPLPFGATRAILVWPSRLSKTLQDSLRATRWATDATRFYGTIEIRHGHLVIALDKVRKKDGTVMTIDYVFDL